MPSTLSTNQLPVLLRAQLNVSKSPHRSVTSLGLSAKKPGKSIWKQLSAVDSRQSRRFLLHCSIPQYCALNGSIRPSPVPGHGQKRTGYDWKAKYPTQLLSPPLCRLLFLHPRCVYGIWLRSCQFVAGENDILRLNAAHGIHPRLGLARRRGPR